MIKAPKDFPVFGRISAIAGAQPKLNLLEKDGRYFQLQLSDVEIDLRYEICADLVVQLTTYCQREKHMDQTWEKFLSEVHEAVAQKPWGLSTDEISWIMQKLALHFTES